MVQTDVVGWLKETRLFRGLVRAVGLRPVSGSSIELTGEEGDRTAASRGGGWPVFDSCSRPPPLPDSKTIDRQEELLNPVLESFHSRIAACSCLRKRRSARWISPSAS